MGYEQGLSGLNAASTDLDVIGNNIANASTVGFKQGSAQFASLYANSVAQSTANNVGIGASVSNVSTNYSQGTITETGGQLDVAINGGGFFQMQGSDGTTEYTRNGQFSQSVNNNIVNAAGAELMGYPVDSSGVATSATLAPLVVPTANISPKATTSVTAQFNLDSSDTAPADAAFNPTDSKSYNNSTSVAVYDTLGDSSNLSLYFVKSATNGVWNVYATNNGTALPSQGTEADGTTAAPAGLVGTASFNSTGALTSFANVAGVTGTPPGAINISVPMGVGGSTTPQSMQLNMTGTTQYGNAYTPTNLSQDGYTSGTLNSFSVGTTGLLQATYSNGQTQPIGQIALVNFNNVEGLTPVGNNMYTATSASGPALVGVPGGSNLGSLETGAVESSNVNLTDQLVDLITAQRNYQANAQTIKTQSTIDQTLFNL